MANGPLLLGLPRRQLLYQLVLQRVSGCCHEIYRGMGAHLWAFCSHLDKLNKLCLWWTGASLIIVRYAFIVQCQPQLSWVS